jgi:hypothetical protein
MGERGFLLATLSLMRLHSSREAWLRSFSPREAASSRAHSLPFISKRGAQYFAAHPRKSHEGAYKRARIRAHDTFTTERA